MNKDYMFCRRKSDGKYYRGSYFWRWTKEWRYAAALPVNFWNEFHLVQRPDGVTKLKKDDVELVGLNDVAARDRLVT